MATTSWAYHDGQRTPKDQGWFVGYLVALLGVASVGFTAWQSGNSLYAYTTFHRGSLDDPRACEENFGRRLLQDDNLDIDHLGYVAVKGVLASAVLATIAALALIQMMRKAPQTMIVIGCSLPIVFFTVLSIMAPFPGVLIPSGFMLALLAFVYYRARNRMRLVGRVMQVAANALAGNTELAAFAVGANAVQLVPLLGFGAALFFLQSNGYLQSWTLYLGAPTTPTRKLSTESQYRIRDPDRDLELDKSQAMDFHGDLKVNPAVDSYDNPMDPDGAPLCTNMEHKSVACCVWQPEGWVPAMQLVVSLVLMWTFAIVAQLRVYVLGGVITQWYFDELASGKIMRSLGHALGPARGTLCFSGAVITACNILRQLADRIRRGGHGIVGIVLKFLLSYLIDLLQEIIRYISTMATIQAAATGDAFLTSARTVGNLLVRNGMKSVTVWWLPRLVLNWTVFGAAALLGVITYGVSYSLWEGTSRHNPSMDAVVLSVTLGLTFLILMGWVAAFITTATEVVYLCYVRDLDNRAVTRAAVHDVLKEVPTATGAVIVQPDDNLMYGALEEGEGGTPVASPSGSSVVHTQPPPNRDLTAAIEAAPQATQSLEPKGGM